MSNYEQAADVLVIGAGASGAAFSWSLSQNGFNVVCLEQGYWMDPAKYPTTSRDWEYQAATNWSFNPNIRQRREDYPVNNEESPISPFKFNAVGGSTSHWTALSPRFHPSDFRVHSLYGVADDWPLSYEDLEPFYDLNDKMMGCAGIAGDPANPPREPRQMPPLPLGQDGLLLANAFDSLGWHWWPSDSYINSEPYGKDRGACNYCGPLGLGCRQRAKASTDVTYWPIAIENGVKLRSRARVFEITTGDDGRVTGASYFDRYGRKRHQPANSVVLACNGIGTPRLMLLSTSDAHPDGLANSSGLLGKNLMFHPCAMATGFFENDLQSYRGPLGSILMSQEFYETDPKRDFARGYMLQMIRGSGPAATAIGLDGVPGRVPWGPEHHKEFALRFGKTAGIVILGEDLPDEQNEVVLDNVLTDSDNIAAPQIRYKVSRNSRKILDHGLRMAKRVLERAGAHTILENPLLANAGWHLMGTARLGEDPNRSVLNPWGQTHDVDNLFVIDGSAFVTAGAVNPTPTIQALALRTADYILNHRTDLRS